MRATFKNATTRVAVILSAMLFLPAIAQDGFAHRIGRPHRHHHRRGARVVVVSAPVRLSHPVIVAGRPHGVIDMNVKPKETEVFVGGKLRGQVDDFDGHPGKLRLPPGNHKIMLRTPEGETYKRKVRIVAGHEINLKLDLKD